MKTIDNAEIGRQLDFLDEVGAEPEKWLAVDIEIEEGAPDTVMHLAHKCMKALPTHNGAILLESPSRIVLFAEDGATVRDSVAEICAQAGSMASFPVIESGLLKQTEERLKKSAANSGGGGRSMLFRHRSARKNNVMMIADDDLFICKAMNQTLGRFGECVVAHDAESALEAYLRVSPDCVFIDLHLGESSGLDVIDGIIGHDKDAYIVMLTGDGRGSQALQAKSRGVKSFLAKPLVLARIEYELFRSPTFRRFA